MSFSTKSTRVKTSADDGPNNSGFTIVELILACVIFPMVVVGVATAFNSLQRAYSTARQLNEMYAVLRACPVLNRALEFKSLNTARD